MLERLEGLDEVEQTACLIAERALGAVATAYDVAGRQGAVEALLDYPDGRRGAFDVTQLATDGGASLQLASRIAFDCRCPASGGGLPGLTERRGIRAVTAAQAIVSFSHPDDAEATPRSPRCQAPVHYKPAAARPFGIGSTAAATEP